MGVEPTQSRFAGGRLPVWLRRRFGFDSAKSVLARIRTWSSTFAESRAIHHTPRTLAMSQLSVPRRGFEPRPAASKAAMRSSTPAGRLSRELKEIKHPTVSSRSHVSTRIRTRTWTFGGSECVPLHHRDSSHTHIKTNRADGWVRTSIILFTRQAPFSVEPRRHSPNQHSTSARSRTP